MWIIHAGMLFIVAPLALWSVYDDWTNKLPTTFTTALLAALTITSAATTAAKHLLGG